MNFWRYRTIALILGFIVVFFLLGLVKKVFAVTPELRMQNLTSYNIHYDVYCTPVISDHLGCCGSNWTWPLTQSFDLTAGASYIFGRSDIGWCFFDGYIYGGTIINTPCHDFFKVGVSCSDQWTVQASGMVIQFRPENISWRAQIYRLPQSIYTIHSGWGYVNTVFSQVYDIYLSQWIGASIGDAYGKASGMQNTGKGKTETSNLSISRGVGLYESFH